MDVFGLRDRVIGDYRGHVQSFLRIADPRIAEFVARRLDEGTLWPDPLVQLSPAYDEMGYILGTFPIVERSDERLVPSGLFGRSFLGGDRKDGSQH